MKQFICLLFFILATARPSPAVERNDFMLGVDANYSLEMEVKGAHWKWDGHQTELFAGMEKEGARWFRVRLWTNDTGTNGKSYATEVVERATKAGLTPYLVIFLSPDWADLMKQPAPANWKDLPLPQRAEAVRKYARDTAQHFRQHGLTSHLYEVGNEIDYGICGVYPGKHAKKNPEHLSKRIWPDAAKLILACEQGVKEADPEAKFLLHIAHWWDADFCTSFFQCMLAQKVQIDFAGLTYFPSSGIGNSLTFDQFGAVVNQLTSAIQRPVIIPETGYPSTADFRGQFARWRQEVPGYPLTPEGQKLWLTDFLKFCRSNPKIAGAFYWSPEWYGEGMWKAFALFDLEGNARTAWKAFHPAVASRIPRPP
ncbi:MAG TPA: glycosyl hydrolase 53 family protein [Chthoniobacterales bacterium]